MKLKALSLLFAAAIFIILTGCSAKNKAQEEQFAASAEPAIENLLQSLNNEDYPEFSKDFNDEMKKAFTEDKFKEAAALFKDKIGSYISKSYWKTQKNGDYTLLLYKAKFDKEPKTVIVTVSLSPGAENILIAGFWLNSPNLIK